MTSGEDRTYNELEPGDTVRHFEIQGKLGSGGMGVVYRARDRKLDRTVALKFLPTQLAGNREEGRRFLREARVASALDHPNICTVYAIEDTPDGRVFIAMASYEGETLRERLTRGSMSLMEWVDIALQTARGLAAAHAQDIVHRDVKPANLMITGGGLLKILDFGLSKAVGGSEAGRSKLTRSGMILGTLAYISPEQVRSEEAGPQSDIWSLGAVLYEMVAGRPPFGDSHDLSSLYQVLHEDPLPLRELMAEVPEEVERIVEKALAKDLDRRYATMDEVIADLERLARNLPDEGWEDSGMVVSRSGRQPTRAPSPTTTLRLSPIEERGQGPQWPRLWGRPVKLWAPFLAAVGVISLLVTWLVTWGFSKPRDGAPDLEETRALFLEARHHLRLLDGQMARDKLTKALQLEPGSAQLHLGLAEALTLLGRESEALLQSENAVRASEGLPAEVRLLFRARDSKLRRDHEFAVDLLERYWQYRERRGDWSPGERLDRGVELVRLKVDAGRAAAALELLDQLRATTSRDPRLALAEAESVPSAEDRLKASREALSLADELQSPLIQARARYLEGRALRLLGDVKGAEAALEAAAWIYAEKNHRLGQADVATTLGNLFWDQGDLPRAKERYERAAELYGAVRNLRLKARPLTNKALVLQALGDLEAATEIFRQALALQRELGDRLGQVYTLVNMAGPMVTTGKLEEAAEVYRQAMNLVGEIQDPAAEALVLEASGEWLTFQGNLSEARSRLASARALAERNGDLHSVAQAELRLGRVLHFQGDVVAAQEAFEHALDFFAASGDRFAASQIRRYLGETLLWVGDLAAGRRLLEQALVGQEAATDLSWAGTRLSLAELLIEEGRPEEAEVLARQSTVDLVRGRWVFEAVRGYEVLARSLVARRAVAPARLEILNAQKLLAELDSTTYRLPATLTAARVEAGDGHETEARQLLQTVLADAAIHGFLAWELEARLALGEMELAGGSSRAGRARLKNVVEEAQKRGLGLIVQKARLALDASAVEHGSNSNASEFSQKEFLQ